MKERRTRRGATLIWVVICMMLFILLLGVGVDVARVLLTTHQLQNATDAMTLAGARMARDCEQSACPDVVYDEIMRIAEQNPVAGDVLWLAPNPENDPDGDIVIGRYEQESDEGPASFTPTLDEGRNAVRVITRRISGYGEGQGGGQIPLIFGGLVGISGANIERAATATIGGGTGAGLLALDATGCGVHFNGNVDLVVNDGSIHINSSGATSNPHTGCAVCTSGSGQSTIVDAPEILTDGGDVCLNDFTGDVLTNVPPADDPLEFLPDPPIGDPVQETQLSISSGEHTISPGYYPQGIVQTGGNLTLEPGIYIVGKQNQGGGQTPPGLKISGGTTVAHGVMFYILDGAVDIGGNANITLTPPNPNDYSFDGSGTYEHVSIFQARTNDHDGTIAGGPGLNIQGTLYFPNAQLELVGTGQGEFGNQIIANNYVFSGNGEITINYNGAFAAPGNRLFLVE